MKAFYSKYRRLAGIAGLIVVSDQITKALILKSMPLYHSVSVIPGFFNITHIHNPGGAFGFLASQSSTLRTIVFLLISSLAVGLVLWFYKQTPKTHPWLASAFAMIFGGAIGNLIDRIRFGKVVDFLDFYLGNLHWPAFNIADSAISIGITVFVIHLLFKKLPD
ncbi:MAG: signal peptidase II [Deltaproteobacteria bacterium]|nr:signal peptidase II [Deltaproteobacteria bacterium]MBT8359226.1 signal peptidase II [Deltaproteobacteria bacterium]NNL42964.1 signal peptidase II [Desulfobacterales bacterium]